jgi:toxin FitB
VLAPPRALHNREACTSRLYRPALRLCGTTPRLALRPWERRGPLVLGEIRQGIELARRSDRQKADALASWLARVEKTFGPHVLPIDGAVADEWERMSALRSIPVIDGLLAATAIVHGLILVTCDDEAVQGLGARVVNPFKPAPA